jgi:hypothetical protein
MKRLFKSIIVMIRLARALMIFMPVDEIYKASHIIPRGCQLSSYPDAPGSIRVEYTFALMDDADFDRIYKINLLEESDDENVDVESKIIMSQAPTWSSL